MLPIRIVAEIDEGQDDNRQTRDAGELQAKGGRFAVRRQFTIFAHLSNVLNAVDQLVLADDPVAVAHQKDEKVKHLRFERYQLGPPAKFAAVSIEHMIAKPE